MADVQMRIYNYDGSKPEMCGNGICRYTQFLQDPGEEKATFVPPKQWAAVST